MSDAAAEKTEKPAGGGNKKLLLIVLVVNVLLAGGIGYFMLGRSHATDKPKSASHKSAEHEGGEEEAGEKEDAKEEEADEEEEPKEKEAKHATTGKFGPLLEIPSFVANLAQVGNGPGRYAKVSIAVEALNEEAKTRVEGALIPIRAEALLMMSNAKAEDVIGQDKLLALSAELLKRVNKLLGKKSIKRVYFSELVVQ